MSSEWRDEFYERAQQHLIYVILALFFVCCGFVLTVHALAPQILLLDQGIIFAHPMVNTVAGVMWIVGGVGALIGILRPDRYISNSWSIERGGWVNLALGWAIYSTATFVVAPLALLSILVGIAFVAVSVARLAEITAGERTAKRFKDVSRRFEDLARDISEDAV